MWYNEIEVIREAGTHPVSAGNVAIALLTHKALDAPAILERELPNVVGQVESLDVSNANTGGAMYLDGKIRLVEIHASATERHASERARIYARLARLSTKGHPDPLLEALEDIIHHPLFYERATSGVIHALERGITETRFNESRALNGVPIPRAEWDTWMWKMIERVVERNFPIPTYDVSGDELDRYFENPHPGLFLGFWELYNPATMKEERERGITEGENIPYVAFRKTPNGFDATLYYDGIEKNILVRSPG